MTDFTDQFNREVHMVTGKKYPIEVVNLAPILAKTEQLELIRNIETQLAEVYSSYMSGGDIV